MKLSTYFLAALFTIAAFLPVQAQIAVKGGIVYTMAGDAIENGVILIRDGKIEAVGSEDSVTIPDGYEVHESAVVTPGLIDARTVVGLAGIYNVAHDQDQLERSNAFQPELRAIDAFNAREDLVKWLRGHGITTIHTGHGPGAVASGQTMIAKTAGNTVDAALVDSVWAVAFTLGPSVGSNFSSPGTRSKAVSIFRSELIRGQEYLNRQENGDSGSRDLKGEIMAKVVSGQIKAMVTARSVTEIMTALRIAREFDIDLVLDGASEAYEVIDEIAEAGVPVIIHPPMIRASGENQNVRFDHAALLHEAGIPFAFQSGFEGYVPKTRVVLFEAAVAVANGLPFEAGLAALTINAAELLGISDRVGSIEPGKDADLALFTGDPFEYVSQVCKVFVNGELVSDECY